MSVFTKAINEIDKKKATMQVLCMNIAFMLEGEAKNSAKWTDRTGNARQGITGTSLGGGNQYIVRLGHGVDYGNVLEEGSAPHVIRPRNAKALFWNGASHPVKQVQHPGTKGTHSLESIVSKNMPKIGKLVEGHWSK